jgi:hypothetical protein
MRKLQNVSKTLNKELTEIFPNIDSVTYSAAHKIEGFTYLVVSVFEQWLGKDNYYLLENVSDEEDKKRTSKLDLLSEKLIEKTKVYTYKFKGKKADRVVFKDFKNRELLKHYCSCTNDEYFKIAIPEYECIYLGADDYTNIIYYRDIDRLKQLLELVSICGLYTIEHWKQ